MSRTYDALRRAEAVRNTRTGSVLQRRFRLLTVTSNKGGVGKTTFASNLAVYLRARFENLPILILGLDEQPTVDRMFGLEGGLGGDTVLEALRAGNFRSAIRLGQYGVHFVPSNPRVAELKAEGHVGDRIDAALRAAEWRGLVIVDTKSDLEALTRDALHASDLAVVVVKDHASLIEAGRVYELIDRWGRPRHRSRVLLSLVDLRVKYRVGESEDVLALLVREVRRLGYPLFETFLSRSPKIEELHTNPHGRPLTILHAAPASLVHRQMRLLTDEVWTALSGPALRASEPDPAPPALEVPR